MATRFLIIQTAFIGDVVLTTPLICALKQRYSDALIDVICTPAGAALLDGIAGVATIPYDKKSTGLISGIRGLTAGLEQNEYDAVLCVHRSPRSLIIGRMVRAKRRVAFTSVVAQLFGYETTAYPQYDVSLHYADKPMRLLALLERTEV